jgi:phenylacetate-CoA ligase
MRKGDAVSEHREHYDELEVRTPSARHLDEVRNLVAGWCAKANAPYYRDVLSNVEPSAINSRAALAQLPVTRSPTSRTSRHCVPRLVD